MNQFNSDLREAWERCSTAELEEKLQAELEKDSPEDEHVLLLLHILEEREAKAPLRLSAREEEALERYRQKRARKKKSPHVFHGWLSIAASVVLVCIVVLAVIPQKAEAETFWEMLQRMTNTVIAYFSPQDKFDDAETKYMFRTDNPGLQQVYDAVVELGITEPMVPTWLPEDYSLTNIDTYQLPMSSGIHATFSNGRQEIIYKLDVLNGEPAHQYYKDDTHYTTWERDGNTYQVARNNELWTVVWEKDRIKCFLTLDCQEETLRRILESIYVMEDE